MQIDGYSRNRVFLAVIVIILFLLIISAMQAKKQNTHYLAQHNIFIQMVELGKQGQYEEVLKAYNQLEPGYAEDFQSFLTVAYAYAALNELEKAEEHLDKALQKSPDLADNAEYLALYGNVLYLKKDYPSAKSYLIRSLKNSPKDDTKQQVEHILSCINKVYGGN